MKTRGKSGKRKNVPPVGFLRISASFYWDAQTGLYEMRVDGEPVCLVRTPEEGAITLREMYGASSDGEADMSHHGDHGRNGL